MKNPYKQRPNQVDVDAWVAAPTAQYSQSPTPEDPKVKFSVYLPRSVYVQINQEILPTLIGKRVGKQGTPLKVSISDYILEAVLADLEHRTKDSK